MAVTILMISSVSWVSSTTGQASTPPKRLNSTALPSITGSAVTIAPASPTQVVNRPMADASAGTATRIVIENPALGSALLTTVVPFRRRCWLEQFCPSRHSGMHVRCDSVTCHDRRNMTEDIDLELEERHALRRVASLSTELADVTEVEYRQLRLERVVLVGVWTEGSATDAENSLVELAALAETAGSQVLQGLIQRRRLPDAHPFTGRGKGAELRDVGGDTAPD